MDEDEFAVVWHEGDKKEYLIRVVGEEEPDLLQVQYTYPCQVPSSDLPRVPTFVNGLPGDCIGEIGHIYGKGFVFRVSVKQPKRYLLVQEAERCFAALSSTVETFLVAAIEAGFHWEADPSCRL
jgi:hypothetical protein